MNNIALLEENGSSMMVEAVSQQPQQPQAYLSHNPEPQAVAGMPRLFVGQVPTDKTEQDLYPLFSSFGTVEKITMVRGPEGKSRGCAMVQFKSWSEAEKAMESLNGTSPLEGGKGRPLVVHFANPRRTANSQTTEPAIAPRKLFVGQIPKTAGEQELVKIFSPFGDVDSVNILKSKGLHAGCAFVQYKKWASCEAAIQALHEQMVMPGCEHPLVVKFADAKKREDVKRGQELFDVKKQMLAMGMMNMGMNGLMASPAMMSTMMGGDMASIGLSMPMGLPGMGSLSGAVNALGGTSHLPLGLGNGKVDSIHTLDGSSRESLLAEGMDGGTNLHTGLGLGDGLHGNGLASIPSGVAGNGLVPGLNGGHPIMAGVAPDNPMGLINGGMGMPHLVVGPQRGKVGRGVTDPSAYAHKLFIGQIPFEANEQDLWGLFAAAGDVLELAILRSQGRSKGCAFLTYATRTQALTAINAFNGRPAGPNKKLVVKFADQK